ncbi:Putative ATP-dependent DNA helicase YjcD [Rubripirellula lacrimiformis]|uniref:DNA 3'-5' helicase n=1 Tax=Rubripirellula lacrimiformis TaxID=1930273 RepID=A0A517N784_9BACT|nr:UvrD-helicase domain-containing protein [Rubripirellula lacrimiformis]QDT02858.1 Putative ATP-dependent DNA helicase YjcD [Rubripirellula lacrimiformis]
MTDSQPNIDVNSLSTTAKPSPKSDSMDDGNLRPTLVRASAGTGKTYRLTARLLRILLQGAAPETILATTFTRKAAGEILERVLLSLARAADESDPDALDALRQQVGIPTLPRSVCLKLLETLLKNIHRLRICTLDSLFSQLARSFPFELGLPPAWRLTDEIEEAWLRERAVDSVIAMLDRGEMMAVLSMLGKGDIKRSIARELLQVVEAAYGSQRLAGPDVWKKLIAPKLPESAEITRAAGVMRMAQPKQKRHRDKLEKMAEVLELRQFDAFAGDTMIANIASARRSHGEVLYYRAPFPEGVDEAFDVAYAAAKSDVLSRMSAQNEATGTVIGAYDHHVGQLKQSGRSIGFEDVAIRLAAEFSRLDQHSLAQRMDGAVDHLLLDEFQDTSPVQWSVLRPMAMRCAAVESPRENHSGDEERTVPKSFFCVGDTKQAIYGWRGGVAEIFDAVADEVPGITEVEQNTSFRSSPVVVDAVNETFKNLGRHSICDAADSRDPTDKAMYEAVAVRDFARRFPVHSTAKSDLPGHFQLETCSAVENGDSAARQRACFEDAARIAAEINAANPDRSIGILTRTNRGVAQLIYLLEQMDVDVSQEGGNPLTDSAAVEMVLSALMMAEHPGDGRWAFHISATPLAKVPGFGADFVRAMCDDRGIPETIEFLAGQLAPLCDARETLRLKQLTSLALGYQQNPAPRLRDFVRMVREKRVERPQAAPVRVMTVHQSKGLEFDAVILPELDGALTRARGGCVPDIDTPSSPPKGLSRYIGSASWHFLPATWQRAFGRQAEGAMTEALCLLYVAMTRARQSLRIVIQPTSKKAFATRTASSLIYHALQCQEDPTEPATVLYSQGDPQWMGSPDPDSVTARNDASASEREATTIRFRPPVDAA